MEFRILGPLEVVEDGRVLDLGGQKQRMLLAVLLLHPNEVVSVDALSEALWQDGPPATAPKVVQVYVSQLRKTLGRDRVETKAPGYLLHVDDGELDATRFRALRAEDRHDEALALWRGSPLGEFAYQRFAQPEIAQLEELRLTFREERVEVDLAAGRHTELVGELEALVAETPLRERLRCQLMLALYRSGRQAEALEAYNGARRTLVDELGIEPSRELRDLHQAVLNQDPALDLASAPADDATSGRGAFVGREPEFAELVAGLNDAFAGRGRLFLLVGAPGIGTSRHADELIARARARGARVVVGRCWEAGGAPAYWPWVQSLQAHVRETQPDVLRAQLGAGAADLAQLLPELRELFPGLGEPPAVEPESARFRLFEAATAFLTEASRTRPLVLVLDDLHAADEPSLLLLRFLARQLGDIRVLVIGAYRDVDPTPRNPLTAAVAELARERVTSTLALSGLDQDDVGRFVELVSGEEPSDELVAAIHEDTEGNPLFVGEIVRLLATEGTLERATGKPPIPQSVRDVIARRLEHLSEECNRLLVWRRFSGASSIPTSSHGSPTYPRTTCSTRSTRPWPPGSYPTSLVRGAAFASRMS
jgi:DNA-binding SARP family transcriptional activator